MRGRVMTKSVRISDADYVDAKEEAENKDMSIKNVIHEWKLMAQFGRETNDE